MGTANAPLKNVYHVCHFEEAVQIFQDGKIRPSLFLVRPMKSRVAVCFLSANRFDMPSSVFGHVSFGFPWRLVVRGKSLFCVEPYNENTFRVLLSKKQHKLSRLNPRRDAPVIYDKDRREWYWNFRKFSQFALEASLSLKHCVRVEFITHGGGRCIRSSGPVCEYPAVLRYDVGAKLLAALLSQKSSTEHFGLFMTNGRLHDDALKAWKRLLLRLTKSRCTGKLRSDNKQSRRVLRRALRAFGEGNPGLARHICREFKNRNELRKTLNTVAAKAFKIPF